MQPTRLHERLADGTTAGGVIFSANSPALAEAFANASRPDFFGVDLQHAAIAPADALDLLRAVHAIDRSATPVARVPNHDVYWIQQSLDAGYEVLIVPLVESAEQAESLVRAAYWPPIGDRSFAGSIRAGIVGLGLDHGNDRVILLPQIESAKGLENVEEIVAVEGVSGVLLGPEDLGVSSGWPRGNPWNNPAFLDAASLVTETCRRHNELPAIFTGDPAAAKKAGFKFIGFAGDIPYVRTAMASHVNATLADLHSDSSAEAQRIAAYQQTVDRFGKWMASELQPDGSWRDATSADAYFSSIAFADYTGRPDLAAAMLRHIERKYVDEQGQLIQQPNRDRMMTYTPAWLASSAFDADMFELGAKMIDYVLSFQCQTCGGFFAGVAERQAGAGPIDFDGTGISIIAAARTGRIEAAVKGAEFLMKLCDAQPRPDDCFYTAWSQPEGLLTDANDVPDTTILRWAEPGQHYYKTGIIAVALAHAYSVTGSRAYLDAATAAHRRAVERAADLWTNAIAHKICWSGTVLHAVTGEASYLDDACRFADFLVSLQQPDGAFHYPGFWPTYPPAQWQSLPNAGAQFALWIARCLNAVRSA